MDETLYTQIMEEIGRITAAKTLVVVEGRNDAEACRELGLTNVKEVKKRPLYSLIEGIEEKEVVLLVDLDKEGKRLYSRLKSELNARGIRVNDNLRELLFRTPVRQIEGLYNYLERWKSRKA